ncbi:MAG: hypothetical protein ABIP61_00490, partial [Burkholderiaceae bacterium]
RGDEQDNHDQREQLLGVDLPGSLVVLGGAVSSRACNSSSSASLSGTAVGAVRPGLRCDVGRMAGPER